MWQAVEDVCDVLLVQLCLLHWQQSLVLPAQQFGAAVSR
jgi:hypothetical protein